jgi:hypothetical protein
MKNLVRPMLMSLAAALLLALVLPPQAEAVCGFTWKQFIEEASGTSNRAYASYYYTSTYYCDNDPDTDYVFVFRLNYSCDPDSLRWWSDDAFTRVVLGNLSGGSPVTSDDDVHVCIGDNSLRIIGGGSINSGIWWIWNYFYLHT